MKQIEKKLKNTMQMTCKQISELTGIRHDNVKRTIKTLESSMIIESTPRCIVKTSTNIRTDYVFQGEQGERDSYVVIAKISPQHIGDIVDVWGRTRDTLANIISALEQFDMPEECLNMQLYAIREKDTGNIKIGISVNPAERLKQLQTANSSELELVLTMPAKNRFQSEALLHKQNIDRRIRGEWFRGEALKSFGEGVIQ